MEEIWDSRQGKFVKTPTEIISFFDDLEDIFTKHQLTLGHEDGHGAFLIEGYDEANINWLRSAHKDY